MACAKCARCGLHTPSLTWESLFPASDILEISTKINTYCKCTQMTANATLPFGKMTAMNRKMTTKNCEMVTNSSSLNFAQQDTQQVSPCLKCTDRLHLLWRDLSKVRHVGAIVAIGAVDRVYLAELHTALRTLRTQHFLAGINFHLLLFSAWEAVKLAFRRCLSSSSKDTRCRRGVHTGIVY